MRVGLVPRDVIPGDLLVAGGPRFIMFVSKNFRPMSVSSVDNTVVSGNEKVLFLRWIESSLGKPPSDSLISSEIILFVESKIWCVWKMKCIYKVIVLDGSFRSLFVVHDEEFLQHLVRA